MSQIRGDVRIFSNDDVEWSVPDLDAPEMENFAEHYSPEFIIRGEHRQLAISPNGLGGYVYVGLKRIFLGLPHYVHFSFALKTANGHEEYERRKIGVSERGEWLPVIRLLPREEYGRRKSELCSSGYIRIVCRMKILTAEGLCEEFNDLSEELNNLKREYEDSQLKLEETEKEKANIELDTCKAGETHASVSSQVCDHDKILQDFKQLLLNQENTDVLLRVRGQEFQAHRAILAARSPVFASTFRNDMKEKKTGIVDIEDCDPSSFPDFLSFIYSNDVGTLSERNVFHLFTASDKYDVIELRTKCLEYMKENVSLDTFCEILTVSFLHNKTELIHVCTDFFVKNAEDILETAKWRMFATENPIQSNELFIKYVKSMKQLNK